MSFKSSPNMIIYHPIIATSSLFSFCISPAIFMCYIYVARLSWCLSCFFKNNWQNFSRKLFARCGSVVIFWSVMTTYWGHIGKGNKLDTKDCVQCPQERRRASAALTWQQICYIISQRLSVRLCKDKHMRDWATLFSETVCSSDPRI